MYKYSIPKSCPNIRFPHQQDFFPIRSVTKSSAARFSHENFVEKFQIFVQDFVPIRTALRPTLMHTKNLYENGPNPFFSGFFNLMGKRMVQIRMAKSV